MGGKPNEDCTFKDREIDDHWRNCQAVGTVPGRNGCWRYAGLKAVIRSIMKSGCILSGQLTEYLKYIAACHLSRRGSGRKTESIAKGGGGPTKV